MMLRECCRLGSGFVFLRLKTGRLGTPPHTQAYSIRVSESELDRKSRIIKNTIDASCLVAYFVLAVTSVIGIEKR